MLNRYFSSRSAVALLSLKKSGTVTTTVTAFSRQRQLPNTANLRLFSSTNAAAGNPKNDEALAAWQKGNWMTYLASGLGSENLFRSIDTNADKNISTREMNVFLESVGFKGVHPRAFKVLNELAQNHELDIEEFKSWLIIATKFGSEKNSNYALDYAKFSQVGEREPHMDGDEMYQSLNKTTMSQAVRRMQVRK